MRDTKGDDSCAGTNPGELIILRAHYGRRLAKLFTAATDGIVTRRDYDRAKWFAAERKQVRGICDLHRVLAALEPDSSACVIRGEPQPAADLSRLWRRKIGDDASFADVPRSWVMLDADSVPLAADLLDDPLEAARALVDRLAAAAPELDGISAVVQFSGSAGLRELAEAEAAAGLPPRWGGVVKPGILAHVWYWLRQPLGQAELVRWRNRVAANGLQLDAATLWTVQPHYTAAPVFEQPLRDPLVGRRTILMPGLEDAADLVVPAPEAIFAAGNAGASAHVGLGFLGHLATIGGADGFRTPIFRAVASYIAANWPDPDIIELKSALRGRIAVADPAGRTATDLRRYVSDAHLEDMIAWCTRQEEANQAARANVLPETVPPTYPDRGIPLHLAQAQLDAIITRFAQRIAKGETAAALVKLTAGGGKSENVVQAALTLLAAAEAGGRSGALYYLVPRHNLSGELRDRIAAKHPDMPIGLWRGITWVNPADPSDRSCLDPELPRAANAADLAPTAVCIACKLADRCQYQMQKRQDARVQLGASNLAFRALPKALPDAALLVMDEDFTAAALAGTDELQPVQLAVSALGSTRTGSVTGIARERLLFLRRLAADVIARQDHDGGLFRDVFATVGFTAEGAKEWEDLEWETKPRVKLRRGMSRDEVLERLAEVAGSGFTRLLPRLARCVRDLLAGDNARSAAAELVRNAELGRGLGTGDVIRFRWAEALAAWAAEAPKLLLNATAEPEILRHWVPDLEVHDIEVAAPHQHVHQIIGRDFGRNFFLRTPGNVARAVSIIVAELARTEGDVLVIAQQAVESLLADELGRRFDLAVPDRLHLAHFGDIAGLDRFRDVTTVIVLGRPALARLVAERLAEVIKGAAVQRVADDDPVRWPTTIAGIRRPDGSGTPVRQPTHPDPLVEAVRRSVTEGSVLQSIARGRGVQRTAARPLRVVVVNDLALPLTVETVRTWEEAVPDRLTVAAAEAALTGRALPLHPQDLHAARSDLWASPAAAERAEQRAKSRQALYKDPIKRLSEFRGLTPARYRKARTYWRPALVPAVAGREALQAVVAGQLTAFELVPATSSPASPRLAKPKPPPSGPLPACCAPATVIEPVAAPAIAAVPPR